MHQANPDGSPFNGFQDKKERAFRLEHTLYFFRRIFHISQPPKTIEAKKPSIPRAGIPRIFGVMSVVQIRQEPTSSAAVMMQMMILLTILLMIASGSSEPMSSRLSLVCPLIVMPSRSDIWAGMCSIFLPEW